MNLFYAFITQSLIVLCHQKKGKNPTAAFITPSLNSKPIIAPGNTPRNFHDKHFVHTDRITENDCFVHSPKYDIENHHSPRRAFLSYPGLFLTTTMMMMMMIPTIKPNAVYAAPPISIIAEELGYFPVTNQAGETMFVPSKIRRSSTPQSIALAKHLQQVGAIMVGAYWCPHCRHQKELLGKEAWKYIEYIEGSPKGYGYDRKLIEQTQTSIEGFPTWIFTKLPKGKKEILVGEASLNVLAQVSNYRGTFDETLEPDNTSATVGSRR